MLPECSFATFHCQSNRNGICACYLPIQGDIPVENLGTRYQPQASQITINGSKNTADAELQVLNDRAVSIPMSNSWLRTEVLFWQADTMTVTDLIFQS